MSTTGNGKGTSFPRDTPLSRFDLVNTLQLEAYRIKDLNYALASVIGVLSETPGVSPHPAVSAAETLITDLSDAHDKHLAILEKLEGGNDA